MVWKTNFDYMVEETASKHKSTSSRNTTQNLSVQMTRNSLNTNNSAIVNGKTMISHQITSPIIQVSDKNPIQHSTSNTDDSVKFHATNTETNTEINEQPSKQNKVKNDWIQSQYRPSTAPAKHQNQMYSSNYDTNFSNYTKNVLSNEPSGRSTFEMNDSTNIDRPNSSHTQNVVPERVSTTLQHIVNQLNIVTQTLTIFEERLTMHEDRVSRVEKLVEKMVNMKLSQ